MAENGKGNGANTLQPIREEFEKVVKKQKTLAKKTNLSLDNLIKDLEATKAILLKEDTQESQKSFNKLGEKIKETRNTILTEQKASHTSLSKFGKAIDKNLKLDLGKNDSSAFEGNKPILNQVIAHHLFREGRFSLGETFSKEAHIKIDESLKLQFLEMFEIFESIKQRNLTPALSWAFKNREKLEQKGSSLEFKLHSLQFISFICAKQRDTALSYAKANFSHFASGHLKEIQRMMGSLLYVNTLEKSPYSDFVSEGHWLDIQNIFTRDCCSLIGLSQESALYISVTVGSTALPTLLKVAKLMQAKKAEWSQQNELPVEIHLSANHSYHSIFVCPVAKEPVSIENPPMLLPCGHVICNDSLAKIIKANGRFKCPYCPTDSTKSMVKRIYF